MQFRFLTSFFLILCFSCAETSKLKQRDQWNIRWIADNIKAEGQLFLSDGKEARIVIDKPDGLFFTEAENVDYSWELTKSKLVLIRKDNGVALEYDLIEHDHDYIRLSYADGFIIEIYR